MNSIPLRQIDQTPPPDRYARGWHCLGLSTSFDDKPKAIMAFGTRIVVFRNSKSDANGLLLTIWTGEVIQIWEHQ